MADGSGAQGHSHSHFHSRHSGLMHMVMMALCCLAPLAAVFILNKMGYGSSASFLMLLLCPLMHFFMMRGRHRPSQVAGADAENRRGDSG